MPPRFSLAPLQWLATADGWIDAAQAPPLHELIATVRESGFSSLKADVPEGMAPSDYTAILAEGGLLPAPAYVSLQVDSPEGREQALFDVVQFAEATRELGLQHLFVGTKVTPERVASPAIGAHADERRLAEIAGTLEIVGEAARGLGVTLCLHPHVGSWVETGAEVEWILDRVDPSTLALGPDTGHLAWAGVDVVEFAHRYADRIQAVHLKDLRLDVARRARQTNASYAQAVLQNLWAEPGLGDLELVGFLDALGPGFDGWVIVEVDRASFASPVESVKACGRWVAHFANEAKRRAEAEETARRPS